jgi:hypothetical protein
MMIPFDTQVKLLSQLIELSKSDDTESAHSQADEVLLEILKHEGGYDEIIEAYENVPKWYA